MAKISEIKHIENRKTHAIVHVLVEDSLGNQEEARVYVGGDVEFFFHNGVAKAFVKKKQSA